MYFEKLFCVFVVNWQPSDLLAVSWEGWKRLGGRKSMGRKGAEMRLKRREGKGWGRGEVKN